MSKNEGMQNRSSYRTLGQNTNKMKTCGDSLLAGPWIYFSRFLNVAQIWKFGVDQMKVCRNKYALNLSKKKECNWQHFAKKKTKLDLTVSMVNSSPATCSVFSVWFTLTFFASAWELTTCLQSSPDLKTWMTAGLHSFWNLEEIHIPAFEENTISRNTSFS